MIYRISMTQKVFEETTIWVEADTVEQAEQQALYLAYNEAQEIEWEFQETADEPVEIASIDEAHPDQADLVIRPSTV